MGGSWSGECVEFAFTMVCTRHRQGEVQNGPCCLAGLCCRSVFGNYIKLAFWVYYFGSVWVPFSVTGYHHVS